MGKKRVLFVGSFKNQSNDGSVGGQMFASKSLIESTLGESIDWLLVDTTATTNKHRSTALRLYKSALRMGLFLKHLIFSQPNIALIFSSNGSSFREKGLMALLAKVTGITVFFAPRSGLIVNDFNGSRLMGQFIAFVFGKVDKVLCQSVSWKSYFYEQTNVGIDRFFVIPNWIDIKNYGQSQHINDVPQILFLAWLDRNKGIFELIEAVKTLATEGHVFKLNLAGDGNAIDEVKEFISKNDLGGHVQMLGWVKGEAKINLLSSSDIFVLPSYFEGYPNALLEAMSSGLACIATDVGSVKDIIAHGENGLMIKKKDATGLADEMRKLLLDKHLRVALGEMARETIIKNNSIEAAVNRFNSLIQTN